MIQFNIQQKDEAYIYITSGRWRIPKILAYFHDSELSHNSIYKYYLYDRLNKEKQFMYVRQDIKLYTMDILSVCWNYYDSHCNDKTKKNVWIVACTQM